MDTTVKVPNMRLSLLAPAKLNLFLHITGRRADGYHNLQTVFQLLDYGDTLHFKTRKESKIQLIPAINGVANTDNLIIKAANALLPLSKTRLGITIQLEKRLPMGAGLGGGSSNAATTLLALNHLWNIGLSCQQLCEIGLTLGADVPVFLRGQSAWAEGIGEKLHSIELPEQWFLVLKPNCSISTTDIFCQEELTRDTSPITVATFFERGEQGCRNDCQDVVCKLYPEVDSALKWLRKYSPPRLTGTGACIFASFSNKNEAQAVLKEVPNLWESFVAKGINRSPALRLKSR